MSAYAKLQKTRLNIVTVVMWLSVAAPAVTAEPEKASDVTVETFDTADSEQTFQVSSECVSLGCSMWTKYSEPTCTKLLIEPTVHERQVNITARLEVFEGCNGRLAMSNRQLCGLQPGEYTFRYPKELHIGVQNIVYPADDPFGRITEENVKTYLKIRAEIKTLQEKEVITSKQLVPLVEKYGMHQEDFDKLDHRISSAFMMKEMLAIGQKADPQAFRDALKDTPGGATFLTLTPDEKALVEKYHHELSEVWPGF